MPFISFILLPNPSGFILFHFLQQAPGNDDPHDLGCAFINLEDLGIPHHLFNRIVTHVTVSAEELQALAHDLVEVLGGPVFCHCGLGINLFSGKMLLYKPVNERLGQLRGCFIAE
jgi:hypothetical protein